MDLSALRSDISGTVLSPDDTAYPAALGLYPAPGPAVIVRAGSADDVATSVRFAVAASLGVAVRSGGHAGPIFAPGDDRLLLDLADLDGISVADDGVVTVGPGAIWGDVATEVQRHGLAITSGDTAEVGVGGLALGGGIGWLVRRDGLTLDSVIGADVVLASGERVTATAAEHPRLLWALRGGGGNFGVVTAFRIHARPLSGVLGVELTLDPERLAETLRALRDVMRVAPDELSATLGVVPAGPPGPDFRSFFHVTGVYAGDDSETARAAIAPLLALPGVLDQTVTASDYRGMLQSVPVGPLGAPIPTVAVRDALIADLDDEVIDAALAARAQLGPSVFTVRFLGGAFGRIPEESTAFAHRSAEAILNIVEFLPPGSSPADGRVAEVWGPVAAHSLGTYGNFTSEVGPHVVEAMYPPATLARLRAIKAEYDPANLFSVNENITPA